MLQQFKHNESDIVRTRQGKVSNVIHLLIYQCPVDERRRQVSAIIRVQCLHHIFTHICIVIAQESILILIALYPLGCQILLPEALMLDAAHIIEQPVILTS